MRLLYTLLAILTVSVASAQSRIVVSHGISHGDNTYTHVKGNNNNAETCFTATGSSTIVGNVNGLVIETIVIDNTPYTWTGVGAEVVADAFSRWDDLNEIYRNRGSQRPILDRTTDLLNCDGWNSDSDGWRINSIYPGYAYYLNTVNGRFEARLTTGYGTATNSQYYQYLPGFGTGVDGSGNTDPNGLGIYFNNGNGFETIEALEEEIILAIGRHMNPQPEEEEEEVEDPATDQWIQGGIQGFLGYGTARYNQQWSNPIYPGYAYNTVDHQYTPNGVFIVRIGVLNSGVWEHVDIPGSHNGEAAADNAARAYIASQFSTLNLNPVNEFRYSVFPYGEGIYYTLVFDSNDEVVSLERYPTFSSAQNAGRTYAPLTPETPTISTNGLCFASETAQNPIGFFANNYITSSITENGISRFDYVTANVAYEYRDINRLNSFNRFRFYPPAIVIAADQIKVISHRTESTIQPSDILASIGINEDCSNLDGYLTTAVNNYRAAYDALAGPVEIPEIVISGWESADAALPATYTNPAYPGWSYLLSRGTGNRSYIISDVMHTDGTRLQINGPSSSSTVVRLRDTAAFHRIGDAHAAARAAVVEAQD